MTARLGQLAKIALVANDSRTPTLQRVADEKGRRIAASIGVDWEEFKRQRRYGYSRVHVRNFKGDLFHVASYIGTKNGATAKISGDCSGHVFFESDDESHIRAVQDLQRIIKAMQKALRVCRRQFMDPCVISFSHGYIAKEAEKEIQDRHNRRQLEAPRIPPNRWLKAPSQEDMVFSELKKQLTAALVKQQSVVKADKSRRPKAAKEQQPTRLKTKTIKQQDFYAGYIYHGRE